MHRPRGRPPKVAAPPGLKGCPRCKKVFDPHEYGHAAYCRVCTSTYQRERTAIRRLRLDGVPEEEARVLIKTDPTIARAPSAVGQLRLDAMREQVRRALNPQQAIPFPFKPLTWPGCDCCMGSTGGLTAIGTKKFCARCVYYISRCGRCIAHARREYIPSLLNQPDPPLLPGDQGYDMRPLSVGERGHADDD